MGAVLIEIGDGQVKLRLPFRDDLVTVGSMVHGGAIAAVADFGVMVAAWAGLDIPEKVRGVTVSLSVDYIEPAIAEDLDIVGTRFAYRPTATDLLRRCADRGGRAPGGQGARGVQGGLNGERTPSE